MCFFYVWDVVLLVHLIGCVTGFKLKLLFFSTSLNVLFCFISYLSLAYYL